MKIKRNLIALALIVIAAILAVAIVKFFVLLNENPEIVARVFGKDVARSDIGLVEGADTKSIAVCDPNGCSAENPLAELDRIISRAAASDFIKRNSLEATKAEIDEFENYMDEFKKRDRIERAQRLAEIEQQLKSTDLSEEQRKELEEDRDLLLRISKHVDEEKPTVKDDNQPDEFTIIWIEGWKANKAIFEKYGGTVAITKFGPDPVGAWKALLQDYEKQGHFKILDKTLRKKFWQYHNQEPEYVASAKEIDFTPYWKKPFSQDANDGVLKP